MEDMKRLLDMYFSEDEPYETAPRESKSISESIYNSYFNEDKYITNIFNETVREGGKEGVLLGALGALGSVGASGAEGLVRRAASWDTLIRGMDFRKYFFGEKGERAAAEKERNDMPQNPGRHYAGLRDDVKTAYSYENDVSGEGFSERPSRNENSPAADRIFSEREEIYAAAEKNAADLTAYDKNGLSEQYGGYGKTPSDAETMLYTGTGDKYYTGDFYNNNLPDTAAYTPSAADTDRYFSESAAAEEKPPNPAFAYEYEREKPSDIFYDGMQDLSDGFSDILNNYFGDEDSRSYSITNNISPTVNLYSSGGGAEADIDAIAERIGDMLAEAASVGAGGIYG